MGGGLVGYDPVFSDPLNEFGDPGLKNQIFKPTLEETDPETYRVYIPAYLNVEDNLRYLGRIYYIFTESPCITHLLDLRKYYLYAKITLCMCL